jgi:hypothetical protein
MGPQDNGEPSDEQFPSKLWKAITTIMSRHDVIEARMESTENAMSEYGRRNSDINRKLEIIAEKLELILTNQAQQVLRIEHNDSEIKRLWAFPLKITAAIIAVGGASVFVWKFVEWLMSAQDITKIPR